ASLSDAEAAALPVTTFTAWEMLFDHFGLEQQQPGNVHPTDQVILVTGAAGGVGSILIQLAKKLTGATVVASASRPESREEAESLEKSAHGRACSVFLGRNSYLAVGHLIRRLGWDQNQKRKKPLIQGTSGFSK
ncbi:Alcohol dehydrogenase, zinc-binding domain protein, partial [Marinobacter algicola DG893]